MIRKHKSMMIKTLNFVVKYGGLIGFIGLATLFFMADERYVKIDTYYKDNTKVEKKLDDISDDVKDVRKSLDDLKLILINRK